MYIYVYVLQKILYSPALGEWNSILCLNSSKVITGESDRSFNSLPIGLIFETDRMFSVFSQNSSSKSSDSNVSEAFCNEIKKFKKLSAKEKEKKRQNLYTISEIKK